MLVLALDTATPAVTVAVADVAGDGAVRVLAARSVVAANRHGELLAPLVAEALDAGGVPRGDLAAVGVGLGPGPFTGLRVGIATAAAFGDALAIPVYGVCSLDVLAAGVRAPEEPFAVVTDARRRQVYWAGYDENGRRTDGPELGPPDEVAAALRSRLTRAVGAGAVLYPAAFEAFDVTDAYPDAALVPALVADRVRAAAPGDVLTPIYLRRPDARPPGAPKRVTPA